ncbi:MAG: hypothetical protein R3B09_14865 [Nannocystaceae bacterium]
MSRSGTETIARALLTASALLGCQSGELPAADLQTLRIPHGAVQSPDGEWLFVTNANLDAKEESSTLVMIDLDAVFTAIDRPADAGAALSESRPCRERDAVIECDVGAFIDPSRSLRLPSGAGTIVLDRPYDGEGPWRLLTASAIDPALSWIDVTPIKEGLTVECGQTVDQRCDEAHTLTRRFNRPDGDLLPPDGARLRLDDQGFRYAYLPHLFGGLSGDSPGRRGSWLTLIALDGRGGGPEIVDVEGRFYRPANQETSTYAGGYAVVSRPCDPADPSVISSECTAPYLLTSHRFWPGIREFSVLTASRTVQGRGDIGFAESNPAVVEDRPYTADLRFEDERGDRLLLVHNAPPAISRIDTRIDEANGRIKAETIATASLCDNPNILALWRPPVGESLALISCYGDDAIAAVSLGAFARVATIAVGDGPNELVVDDARRLLYVVETLGDAIAIVDLDSRSSRYLKVIARLAPRDRLESL